MNQKMLTQIAGIIFTFIAAVHALRLALGWEAVLGGWVVPMWISLVAILVAGYLAYKTFKLMK